MSMYKLNSKTQINTGSKLLDKLSPENMTSLRRDIIISSKNKSQNVRDFILETRTW